MSYRHSIHFPPPPPPPPPPRPQSEPPQFAFHPQRAPFAPPPLLQEESSGTTFLADLASVSIPPVRPSILNPQASYIVKCNCCGADLTGRPRVHCLQCEDYDVCSHCHAFGEIGRGHRKTHTQQTLKPMEYPRIHRRSYTSDTAYRCDVCNKDLTNEPRARCLECKS